MAFVPDEAVLRAHELKRPLAFTLYAYYCLRRNSKTGVCFPSLKTTAEETGINYTYCSEMRSLLLEKGWVEMVSKHEMRPLMGFDVTVKSSDIPKIPTSEKFGYSEDSRGKSSDIPKLCEPESSDIPNIVSDIPNISFGYSEVPYIEPEKLTRELEPLSERERRFDAIPIDGFVKIETPPGDLGNYLALGVRVLTANRTTSEPAAKKLILGLVSQYGDDAVRTAIMKTDNKRPGNPAAYLTTVAKSEFEKPRQRDGPSKYPARRAKNADALDFIETELQKEREKEALAKK